MFRMILCCNYVTVNKDTNIHAYIRMYIDTYKQSYVHSTCIHSYVHTYTHTYTCTYIHAYIAPLKVLFLRPKFVPKSTINKYHPASLDHWYCSTGSIDSFSPGCLSLVPPHSQRTIIENLLFMLCLRSLNTGILFLHQSTGRLPLPGCTNTNV